LREKRQEILAIAAKHGAYNVRIFGSVARGEAARRRKGPAPAARQGEFDL
jgi:predicted nucleotidyltransferase